MTYVLPGEGSEGPVPVIPPGADVWYPPQISQHGTRVILAPIAGITPKGLFAGQFVFQCPPTEDVTENYNYNHNDYSTAFAGDFSRDGGAQLDEITFSTLWMDDGSANHAPSWALVKRAMSPLVAKEKLVKIQKSGAPFWLMVHQMPLWHRYDVRMYATLRSITSMEKAGEPDARYFSMQFRQWRDARVSTRKKGKGKPHGATKKGPRGTAVATQALATSDTLYSLATNYYGTATAWSVIAKANGLTNIGPSQPLKAALPKKFKKLSLPATPAPGEVDPV